MKNIQHVRTPTGVLALIAATAEKLLKEGVISGSLDGDLHAADAATVKAAIMASAVCDFCSTPGATHYYDVPDFGVTFGPDRESNYSQTKSTGGWMACDVCDALVRKDNRKALVDRAIETMAFPKFSRKMIEEFVSKFWQGMDEKADAAGVAAACVDFIEDRTTPALPEVVASQPKADRIEAVMRSTGLDRKQVVAMMEGKFDHRAISKLTAFQRRCGGDDRRMAAMIQGSEPPPLKDITPHWQRALDVKFDIISRLSKILRDVQRAVAFDESMDITSAEAIRKFGKRAEAYAALQDLQYQQDVKHLTQAETFSFGADPIVAIMEAAKMLPRDAPLSSVEVPTGAGWFWFSTALPIKMTSNFGEDGTDGLLWGWTKNEDGEASMRFSGFVLADGHAAPATSWNWPLHMTLDEMVKFNVENYVRDYELPGGVRTNLPTETIGREKTTAAIEQLSAFFLAACMWFKQKVLVSSQGHVERHARKRIQREHKLKDAPTVRIIALRAGIREQVEKEHGAADAKTGERKLHVRFVVTGHPRLQRCGPGRSDVKLIWIAPYPKGPDGAPFKERQKVFAVIR
jgi:hypothetical protein